MLRMLSTLLRLSPSFMDKKDLRCCHSVCLPGQTIATCWASGHGAAGRRRALKLHVEPLVGCFRCCRVLRRRVFFFYIYIYLVCMRFRELIQSAVGIYRANQILGAALPGHQINPSSLHELKGFNWFLMKFL